MDLLTDTWAVWNQHVEATIATVGATIVAILSVYAFVKKTGSGFLQMVSDVRRWKGWAVLARFCKRVIVPYRVRRAKSVIRQSLEGSGLKIPIEAYAASLRDDPSRSTRDRLKVITPAKPSWLSDYYVATALESLSNEGKVGKAKRYGVNAWPPRAFRYDFAPVVSVEAAHGEVVRIETTDYCVIYQLFEYCRRESRFDPQQTAETVSPFRTKFTTSYVLKDTAPPCDLCWEKDSHEEHTRMLVEKITKYDLAREATEEITGENGELQDAVVAACIESKCPIEPNLIRQVVKQAIEFRQRRNALSASRLQHESLQGEHQELVAALNEYINNQKN